MSNRFSIYSDKAETFFHVGPFGRVMWENGSATCNQCGCEARPERGAKVPSPSSRPTRTFLRSLVSADFIVHAFDTLEAAETKGRDYPAALESHLIPGAGGNVYGALDLLRRLKDGMRWGLALKGADDAWASCDGHPGTDRWLKGQEQADWLKMSLHDRVGTWLGIKGPLPA